MKKPLVISAVLGVVAALFIAMYLNSLESTYKKGAQKVKVLVAKEYLDQATMLDETLVEERTVPKDYLQPRAIQSIKDLTDSEGRRLFMTVVPVEKGEQIITTKLYMLGLDTGISGIIPNDKRAITMVFDKEAISGVIKPGNRVDVIGIFEYEDKDKQRQEVATTILQNVLVISVGRSVLGAVKPVMTSKKDVEKAMVMESADSRVPVSLAVSPSEVEILSLAAEKGTIKFSLRAPGDDKIYLTEGTKMQDIFKEISATAKGRAGEKAILPDAYIKEMQRKQQEAVDLLKKYQKK